jgi:hypothetical protein
MENRERADTIRVVQGSFDFVRLAPHFAQDDNWRGLVDWFGIVGELVV